MANMLGVFSYVRTSTWRCQSSLPEIPDELNYGGLQWTQDIRWWPSQASRYRSMRTVPRSHPPPLYDDLGESGYNPQPPPPHIVPGRAKRVQELQGQEARGGR